MDMKIRTCTSVYLHEYSGLVVHVGERVHTEDEEDQVERGTGLQGVPDLGQEG